MLLTVNQQEKSISFPKRGFPNLRPTQLKLTASFFPLLSLSEVVEFQVYLLVPAVWVHLHQKVSALT